MDESSTTFIDYRTIIQMLRAACVLNRFIRKPNTCLLIKQMFNIFYSYVNYIINSYQLVNLIMYYLVYYSIALENDHIIAIILFNMTQGKKHNSNLESKIGCLRFSTES